MTRYLRCIKDIPIEPELPVFYFKSGKDYEDIETRKDNNSFVVKDEFKKTHIIIRDSDPWFDEHFRVVETEVKEETYTKFIWTNGNAIRKYVGQDKSRDTTKKGWYKAKAEITRVVEETEIQK